MTSAGESIFIQMESYRKIPKVELHRHLEGSLRVKTLEEIARREKITLPPNSNIARLVQVQQDEPQDFRNFLSKFDTLRKFYLSKELIERYTRETLEDAAADGILYLELTFTPPALSRISGFDLGEVMDWVTEAARLAAQACGVEARLLVSINRHESIELAEQVVEQAVRRIHQGIAGLSMAGNEAEFPAVPFLQIFRYARTKGLALVLHAGEWGGAANVREALELFDADRIGHGVHVMDDESVVELARKRGVPFEVCLMSNLQSGVAASLTDHPLLRMLAAGLNVTLHTDDPGISNITLSDEYRLAVEGLGLPPEQLRACILNAARAAFLPPNEKTTLLERIQSHPAWLEES